jgi:hypothetical protein
MQKWMCQILRCDSGMSIVSSREGRRPAILSNDEVEWEGMAGGFGTFRQEFGLFRKKVGSNIAILKTFDQDAMIFGRSKVLEISQCLLIHSIYTIMKPHECGFIFIPCHKNYRKTTFNSGIPHAKFARDDVRRRSYDITSTCPTIRKLQITNYKCLLIPFTIYIGRNYNKLYLLVSASIHSILLANIYKSSTYTFTCN